MATKAECNIGKTASSLLGALSQEIGRVDDRGVGAAGDVTIDKATEAQRNIGKTIRTLLGVLSQEIGRVDVWGAGAVGGVTVEMALEGL